MNKTITFDPAVYKVVPTDALAEMLMAAEKLDWTSSDVLGNCNNMWNAMIAEVPDQLPGVAEHSGEPVARAYSLGDGDFRIDYSFPQEKDYELFAHPAPSQPSAEALVQAALEAACDAVYTLTEKVGDRASYDQRDLNCCENTTCELTQAAERVIRALDKQKIIDGVGK